jgi:hypothetical protein
MEASHGLIYRQTERSENVVDDVWLRLWKGTHSGGGRWCKRWWVRPRYEQEPSAWQQTTCLQMVCKHGVHGQKMCRGPRSYAGEKGELLRERNMR